jgi:hypothetical protein
MESHGTDIGDAHLKTYAFCSIGRGHYGWEIKIFSVLRMKEAYSHDHLELDIYFSISVSGKEFCMDKMLSESKHNQL